MSSRTARASSGVWPILVGGAVVGYLVMSRAFAYLGVPPLNVFVGEVLLGAILVLRPEAVVGPWRLLLRGTLLQKALAWSVLLFSAYGAVELAIGLSRGYPLLPGLKGMAFNYYSVFLLVGVWVAASRPDFLERVVRVLVWANAFYGAAYVLFLGRLPFTVPGADRVFLFGPPFGSAAALLGLVAFAWRPGVRYPLMLLNAFVLLGMQVRAEWLALAVGLTVYVACTRRVDRALVCVGVVVILWLAGVVTDVRIPSPTGRGGEISAYEVFARGVAVLSPDVAGDLSPHAEFYAGTANWRLAWWRAIWASVVHDSGPGRILFGHGLGYPLHAVVDFVPPDVRSPHNALLFAFAYGGLCGAALFAALQGTLVLQLLQAFRRTGQPFGLSFCCLGLTIALFSNFIEAPFGAIPFYVLTGVALAPVLYRPQVPLDPDDAPSPRRRAAAALART